MLSFRPLSVCTYNFATNRPLYCLVVRGAFFGEVFLDKPNIMRLENFSLPLVSHFEQ
jgi:hypothetical protein